KRLAAMIARSKRKAFKPMTLAPLEAKRSESRVEYKYVTLDLEPKSRKATITVRAPGAGEPTTPDELAKAGCNAWAVRAFRELDDALLDLRFNHLGVGVVAIKTEGDAKAVLDVDAMLSKHKDDGLVHEVTLLM